MGITQQQAQERDFARVHFLSIVPAEVMVSPVLA